MRIEPKDFQDYAVHRLAEKCVNSKATKPVSPSKQLQ
jgi:hypothetical protein